MQFLRLLKKIQLMVSSTQYLRVKWKIYEINYEMHNYVVDKISLCSLRINANKIYYFPDSQTVV